MKWHCGVILFSTIAGASFFGSFNCPAQATAPTGQPMAPPPAVLTAVPPVVEPSLDKYLKFDADDKTATVTNGEPEAHFSFTVTNISSEDVLISYIVGSCHCTVAQMPSTPWKLAPKEGGEFTAVMQMDGTPPGGEKFKTLTVGSDKGFKVLNVTSKVLPDPVEMTEMDRTNNMRLAKGDRQAVFKGDCVSCHVTPAKDAAGQEKMGQDLYAAVCGVCHEAAHQASFVPNLHRLPEPTSAEFWRNWVMHGKPGTLMPAFAKVEGGILSEAQVDSLVQYLSAAIPSHPVVPGAPSALKVSQ